jgi:hypothetical protein
MCLSKVQRFLTIISHNVYNYSVEVHLLSKCLIKDTLLRTLVQVTDGGGGQNPSLSG